MLEQVRTIDKSRIKGFLDILDKSQMKEVEKALKISFGIGNEYSKKSSHNL